MPYFADEIGHVLGGMAVDQMPYFSNRLFISEIEEQQEGETERLWGRGHSHLLTHCPRCLHQLERARLQSRARNST